MISIEFLHWRLSTGSFWKEKQTTIEYYQLWEIYFEVETTGGSRRMSYMDTTYYYPTVQVILNLSVGNKQHDSVATDFLRTWAEEHFGNWKIKRIERFN